MNLLPKSLVFAALVVPGIAVADPVAKLSNAQRVELAVFGMKAMGLKVSPKDVGKVPNSKETVEMVATGINLGGNLCATVTSILPLRTKGHYEVTCIANRGGEARKSYTVDSNTGKARTL
jgi:hypothetical protein